MIEVELYDLMEGAIIDGLDIDHDELGTTLSFSSSYGAHGRLRAERVRVAFVAE